MIILSLLAVTVGRFVLAFVTRPITPCTTPQVYSCTVVADARKRVHKQLRKGFGCLVLLVTGCYERREMREFLENYCVH